MIDSVQNYTLMYAISLTPAVNDWLKNSRRPRVLHVFDRACNLINERREVLSIVTPQIGNGPFNLVIEDDVLFSEHLHIQSPISIRESQLFLGNFVISVDYANIWCPVLIGKSYMRKKMKSPIEYRNYKLPTTNSPVHYPLLL
jgi:hypothetical protein